MNIPHITIPTIPELFNGAIDVMVYILSILGALSIILIGALVGVCTVITLINIIISVTYKACKRIRNGKRNV
jgi:hypothetical protein